MTAETRLEDPVMDEHPEYLSIDEAAQLIGWNRATVFEWVKTLGMEKHKFLRNKKTYLKASDVARLKEIKEKPWLAGERRTDRDLPEAA
jgi:predicted site-specific integrase-resolvase